MFKNVSDFQFPQQDFWDLFFYPTLHFSGAKIEKLTPDEK